MKERLTGSTGERAKKKLRKFQCCQAEEITGHLNKKQFATGKRQGMEREIR